MSRFLILFAFCLARPVFAAPAPMPFVSVAGTKVQVALPEGFEPMDAMTGFTNAQGDVIAVQQFPAPMEEVLPPMGAEKALFAKHGMQFVKRESFGGIDGSLIHVEQAFPTGTAEKWIRYLPVEGGTAMVMVSFNKEDPTGRVRLRPLIETAKAGDAAPAAAPPYTVEVGAPLIEVPITGMARVFSESGKVGGPASEALVVTAPGIQPVAELTRKMCVDKIKGTAMVEAIQVEEKSIQVTPTRCTVEAVAKSTSSGDAVYLFQHLVRSEDGRYAAMVGRVGVDQRDALRPVFTKSAETLEWKSNTP